MDAKNFNEVYGYYLLAQEGLLVYNPKYVARYGSFMRCLKRLKYKPKKETTPYLEESYRNSAESAKFYATYPADLSTMSLAEIRKLRC